MTVSITTSYRTGIVSGDGVTTVGPIVPAITTDDIFNPNAPTQTLTDMLDGISSAKLIGSAIITGTSTGDTSIFTIPAGKVLIPTEVIFALTHIAGSGAVPVVNLGYTAGFDQYIHLHTLTGLSTAKQLIKIDDLAATASSAAAFAYAPAGNTLTLHISTAATYSTYTMTCFVFGFLTTTPV